MAVNEAVNLAFLNGGGEMGELIKTQDWSQTTLGPLVGWPQSLRSSLGICLNAPIPILIGWGSERIRLYNDAYRLILGDKHPHVLGSQGEDDWPDPSSGFSQIPIYDETNGIGGIFCLATAPLNVRQTVPKRQHIEVNEQVINAMIQQMPLGVGVFRGPDFVVELANPTICQLWGRTHEQVLGKPIFTVLPEATGQGFEELLQGVYETGIPYEGHELPVTLKRNELIQTVYVNFVYEPLRDQLNGPITGIVVVGTDVTEQVLVRQQTEQLLERERELNELKSNFVTLASHEFRTPMGTILSSVALIGRYNGPDDGEKRDRHVQRIKSAVHGLTGLLNDFLSLSQMEKSTLHGSPHLLDIVTFCEEVIDDMQEVTKPNQRIVYNHQSGESIIMLDGQMLKNILVNLLVNASKYSAENKEINLTTSVADNQLELTVRDEGIGIPDADKDKLFINFFRARNVTHVEGTGLGLYIVKRYVDLLGGTITFTSQLDSGTIFTIQLPLTPSST